MANQNFTDFTLKTPASGDFLVGYSADGSNEFKTTVNALVSSFATTTTLNAASSVLLPTSVYRSASAAFVTNTALNAVSSVLLPTSIYTAASANWQSSYEYVNEHYENWDSVYAQVNELSSSWQGGDLSSYATNTALNAASSVLLPTSVYRATSGTFLVSDTTTTPTASSISNVILISQTEYNNLPVKVPTTLYFIV